MVLLGHGNITIRDCAIFLMSFQIGIPWPALTHLFAHPPTLVSRPPLIYLEFKELLKEGNIMRRLSWICYPQVSREIERFNRVLKGCWPRGEALEIICIRLLKRTAYQSGKDQAGDVFMGYLWGVGDGCFRKPMGFFWVLVFFFKEHRTLLYSSMSKT